MSFYRGFMDGMNESRQQTERDTRLAMDIEGKRAALGQSMAQEGRARERMELERERAIRDARASDFDFEQKKGAAERDKQLRDEMTGIVNEFTTPREEVGPDGTKKTLPPLMSTPEGQLGMYTRIFKARSKAGLVSPAELKQFQDFGKEVERSGLVDAAIRYSMGDKSGLAAIAKRAGVDPAKIDLQTEYDPKTKLATTKIVGVGPNNQPFSVDLAPAYAAWGANYDPDKAANDRVERGAIVEQRKASAAASADTGYAARTNADSLTGVRAAQAGMIRARTGAMSGASGGTDFNPKEAKDFNALVKSTAPKVTIAGREREDADGRELLRTIGSVHFADSVSAGTRPSTVKTIEYAQNVLLELNRKTDRLLRENRYVIDPQTRQARLATDPAQAKSAIPFGRLPETERARLFEIERRSELERARAKQLKKQAEANSAARTRALNAGGGEDEE